MQNNEIGKKRLRPTGSLAQAGVLPRGTLRRNLEVYLPSEPYRYPRLPQAAKTLCASSADILADFDSVYFDNLVRFDYLSLRFQANFDKKK